MRSRSHDELEINHSLRKHMARLGPRLTIRQHHFLPVHSPDLTQNRLLSPGAWDALREDPQQRDFAFAATQAAWRQDCCSSPEPRQRAAWIAALARRYGVSTIKSLGCGRGCLEMHLAELAPDIPLHISDYAPRTVARLRDLLPEVTVRCEDIRAGISGASEGFLIVLHRVDTELTDDEWTAAFGSLADDGVGTIVMMPTGFLTAREAGTELGRRIASRVTRRTAVFAGFVRTRVQLERLWSPRYAATENGTVGGVHYFVLQLRSPRHA